MLCCLSSPLCPAYYQGMEPITLDTPGAGRPTVDPDTPVAELRRSAARPLGNARRETKLCHNDDALPHWGQALPLTTAAHLRALLSS